MKSYPVQQEILLLSNTTFSNRELCKTELLTNHKSKLYGKRLEKALQSDLLDKMLPEISEKSKSGKKLHVWNVRHGNAFFEIELGNHPELVERSLSIDPYEFLPVAYHN